MARTRKSRPIDKAILEDLCNAIRGSELKELVFVTGVPAMPSVQLEDGQYRKKTLPTKSELVFLGMRPGSRAEFIFEFDLAVHDEKWRQIEFDETAAFAAIPNFEQALIGVLGDYEAEDWEAAKKNWFLGFEPRQRALAAATRKADESSYEDDPMWGMF